MNFYNVLLAAGKKLGPGGCLPFTEALATNKTVVELDLAGNTTAVLCGTEITKSWRLSADQITTLGSTRAKAPLFLRPSAMRLRPTRH